MNFSNLFEAVAITAGAKVEWPGLEPGRARVVTVPLKRVKEYRVFSIAIDQAAMLAKEQETPLLPRDVVATMSMENIALQEFWTGSEYLYMGFGSRSNTLVIGVI